MKAAEFYRQWTGQVAEAWACLGVSRVAGRGCRWRYAVGDKTLFLFVETNPKYAWTLYGGGDFSINAYFPDEAPPDPAKYTENVLDGLAFFSYWDAAQTERRLAANRAVYDKLRGLDTTVLYERMAEAYDCTPAQARDQQLYEDALEMMEMDLEDPSDAFVNPPLHYYDAEDVETWAGIVTDALPAALKAMSERPEYVFRTDG